MEEITEQKVIGLKMVFTSYRDSIGMNGLKVSIDKYAPKSCAYPTLSYLTIPQAKNLSLANMERICLAVLDNNCDLIRNFINDVYKLKIGCVILCDWITRGQILYGKFCPAKIIGNYIQTNIAKELEFSVEIEYRDGRDTLPS